MAYYRECRILAIIGSGETSPTMVTVHRDLLARLAPGRPRALLLSTPYAFQENAVSVSARAQRYFADSVGLQVAVAAGINPGAGQEMAVPTAGDAPALAGVGQAAGTAAEAADAAGEAAGVRGWTCSADSAWPRRSSRTTTTPKAATTTPGTATWAHAGSPSWNVSCRPTPPSWAWTSTRPS
jgi:hypothetical protein